MTALSAVSRIPLPTDDDVLDFNGICANFCNYVDNILIPRYNSIAERDSAHASSVTVGEICTVSDASGGVLLQTYAPGGWVTVEDIETVFKAADTARASTTTLAADPDLKFNLLPSSTYLIRGMLGFHSASASPDIKMAWSVTGSATTVSSIVYGGSEGLASGGEPGFVSYTTNHTDPVVIGLVANSRKSFEVLWYVKTSSSSPPLVSLSWAQNSNNGTALTLLTGSFLEASRIG